MRLAEELVSVGKVSGIFGVRGWIKVYSYTEIRENILTYSPWILRKGKESKSVRVIDGRRHGKTVVACLEGLNDRDEAAELNGWEILINADQLPKARQGEYYWTDLVGLRVMTVDGIDFGTVEQMLETGANDVVVVSGERERLIPFLQGQTIINIDLLAGEMLVDWDADF
ncbi:ribosome maturation factor RimM [Methylococcaceae bacterium HT4]|nr:ribosome maturation factor RimM [Methylococcaceae bacterium CS4]TXK98193.1 ribosome maturation factor RimM [Methylococcaceae bacterium CS5]TXL04288.1 ribosome maturation factor RimM [Methylococcaceae bacterium CS1]TXL04728.1 ribosome maturation factor RimM [Methylococcaceae bacterium CS3]TXL10655.1 ribosome maturation factor RimM [Methylococcaceae bacterium CS2]TXL14633.1 ribosome maturation factor RimM [Methylococcaceae bacterium HT4]TXL18899.1 ribosome maturation factor RimM [Methylococc